MKYKIIGQTVSVVEMILNAGETAYTQSGGMAYQTEGIKMKTNACGGVMKSLGRMFTGESIFMVNYTAQKDGAMVAFQPSVSYEIETVKGIGNIFLGGEGLFLTKLVGPGRVILQSQNFKDFANSLVPYMPQPRGN